MNKNKSNLRTHLIAFLILLSPAIFAQNFQSEISLLNVDTQYCNFQFHSPKTAQKFKSLFDSINHKRVVLFHYGASHIQAEVVTTKAKEFLHKQFFNAGYGYLFPFSAAKTYSSVNYRTLHYGDWSFAKSFQIPPKIPLGLRGITIETSDTVAGVSILFNEKIPIDHYELTLFFDNNELTPNFQIKSGNFEFEVNDSLLQELNGQNFLTLELQQDFEDLNVNVAPTEKETQLFRFYGFSLEKKEKRGLLYHSLGVGASPFEAVLHMEKLAEQAKVLKPDIVMLDYGTNNILYKNAVPEKMGESVAQAVKAFREINPEIIIVLTSTQDLFYKGRYIDAAVEFKNLMDSLAILHDCMYWNFYDLSGGFAQIRHWQSEGYAQKDHIHLTHAGYKLKGYLLSKSILNTLNFINNNPEAQEMRVLGKNYDELIEANKKPIKTQSKAKLSGEGTYVVKSGDTLYGISRKFGTSVNELKRKNNLKGDLIRIGDVLQVK